MENIDKKFDELAGAVKDNTAAIGDLTAMVKKTIATVDNLVVLVKENTEAIGEFRVMAKDNTSAIGELRVMAKDNATTIDDLAVMVKNGFDHVGEEIHELKVDVKSIKNSMVHDFQHNALEQRVEALELKAKAV